MLVPDLGRALQLRRDRPEELLDVELIVHERDEVLLELRARTMRRLHVHVRGEAGVGHRSLRECRQI